MELIAHNPHRIATTIAAGLFTIAAMVLMPAAAQATRIPADPTLTSVPTPSALAHFVSDTHAANVWSAIQDLRAEVNGSK